MATAQTAICAEASAYGIFITFLVKEPSGLRQLLAEIPALTTETSTATDEPGLLSAIGIGAAIWPKIFDQPAPSGLVPFAPLGTGKRTAPATPADLFLHIRSARHDASFVLARAVIALLGDHVEIVEEAHGHRRRQGRDLTGFVDGTENPHGGEQAGVALVADGPHQGGSFVSIQRYVHDLTGWEKLSVADQEARMGRSKEHNVEMEDEVKPPGAHIARVVIEEDGEELEILRQSLPYGDTKQSGLYFIAYCASPAPFRKMLKAMVVADGDGHYDRLLDYTRAVTGAAFFVPSIEFLSGAPDLAIEAEQIAAEDLVDP